MKIRNFLWDLDREIGDADHGVNLARGYKAVLEKIPQEEAELGTVLKKTGMTLLWMTHAKRQRKALNIPKPSVQQREEPAIWAIAVSVIRIRAPHLHY